MICHSAATNTQKAKNTRNKIYFTHFMRCWFKNASFRIFEHTFYYFHWILKVDSVSCIQLDCFIHEIVVIHDDDDDDDTNTFLPWKHQYTQIFGSKTIFTEKYYVHSIYQFFGFLLFFFFGFRKLTKHTVFGKAKVRILRKEIRFRQRNDSFLITINKIAFVASKHYIVLKSGYSLRRNMMTKSLLL